jgi:hypothetical protein
VGVRVNVGVGVKVGVMVNVGVMVKVEEEVKVREGVKVKLLVKVGVMVGVSVEGRVGNAVGTTRVGSRVDIAGSHETRAKARRIAMDVINCKRVGR